MNNRGITFEGVFNARDMGGLQTAQGSMIASGLLLRSANLVDATETDKMVLREKYRIAKIIDLRTETERNEKPDVFIPNVEYLSIPVFGESVYGTQHNYRRLYADKRCEWCEIGKILSDDATGW